MVVDNFLDIIKHTYGLGFVELVKVIGTDEDVKIEAMDNERTVIVFGKLVSPVENLEGTVGLSRIQILDGYLNFPPFASDNASVSVELKPDTDIPVEIKFDSNDGHESHYRFMSAEQAEQDIKIPPFKGATWDLKCEPTKEGLNDLRYISNILSTYEDTFTAKFTDTRLEFFVGDGPTDRSKILFSNDVTGELKHAWSYPLSQILAILKLYDKCDSCVLNFSDQGILKIEIDSGLGEYEYYIVAKSK